MLCHAKYLSGFPLSGWNSLDSSTENHRKIARIINHKCHYGCSDPSALVSTPDGRMEPESRTIENNDQLKHQRCSTDDPDQNLNQTLQRFKLAEQAKCQHQPKRQRKISVSIKISKVVARPVKSDCVTVQNMIYFSSGTTTTCALLQ